MAYENDLVVIYFEERAVSFARIEHISPDVKPGWYQVKLLLLQLPLKTVTWILREAYINGSQFTMNGNRMRLEKVVCPEESEAEDSSPEPSAAPESGSGRIISLSDRKKPESR